MYTETETIQYISRGVKSSSMMGKINNVNNTNHQTTFSVKFMQRVLHNNI